MIRRLLLLALVLLPLTVLSTSCESGDRKRPYGWVRVGKVADLSSEETAVPARSLFVRRDAGGFAAMSSLCTHDLVAVNKEGSALICRECGSRFAVGGAVETGPAKHPLPYFALRFDQGEIDGPVDTLYAEIGREVSPAWRLKLPE